MSFYAFKVMGKIERLLNYMHPLSFVFIVFVCVPYIGPCLLSASELTPKDSHCDRPGEGGREREGSNSVSTMHDKEKNSMGIMYIFTVYMYLLEE